MESWPDARALAVQQDPRRAIFQPLKRSTSIDHEFMEELLGIDPPHNKNAVKNHAKQMTPPNQNLYKGAREDLRLESPRYQA